jgi:hypothetical protein
VLLLLVAVCAQPRLGRCVQILFNTQLDYDPPIVETPMRISFNFRLDGTLSRCTSRTKTSASNVNKRPLYSTVTLYSKYVRECFVYWYSIQ